LRETRQRRMAVSVPGVDSLYQSPIVETAGRYLNPPAALGILLARRRRS